MKKFQWLLAAMVIIFLLMFWVTAVLAQGETPPPYAGLQNPFSWDDASVQELGGGLYQRSCLGCHGANGGNIAGADFSTAAFARSLPESPDFYFWTLSEGRLSKGMPPFKSSLSEEQRWQVLTYLHTLGTAAPPSAVSPPSLQPSVGGEGSALLLTAPEQAQSGQLLTLTVSLKDSQGNPIKSAAVQFLMKVDFFVSGLMEIGEAVTDGQGIAQLKYTPRQTGDIQLVARYAGSQTATKLTLLGTDKLFYQTKVGLLTPGKGVSIGPDSAFNLGEGNAPATALRVPGGLRSVLLLAYVCTVVLVWSLYLRVMYQMLRIPIVSEIRETNTRLVPFIGMTVMAAVITLLVLILITGPYSHWHLPG